MTSLVEATNCTPCHPRQFISDSDVLRSKMEEVHEQWHRETFGCRPGEISLEEAWAIVNAASESAMSAYVQTHRPKPQVAKQPKRGYRQCPGVTKKGLRCQAGAEHGYDTCPNHRHQQIDRRQLSLIAS